MFLSSVIPVVVWTTQVVARHVSESLCDFEICGRFDHFFSKQTSVSRKNNCFRWRVFDLPQSRGSPPPLSPRHASDIWRVVGSTCGRMIYASNYRSGSGMLPHGVSCHGYWDWRLLARNGFALPWFSSLSFAT